MAKRSLETLTDILVLVVSPALVMILVGSLAFFMIQCFYDGQFFGKLNFATGLFVIASVLIARIAIEDGREYASGFALPLGVVTILSILQYTDLGPLFAIPMVLFIWWSTDKLTWDCTVLDEQKDASGKGLLQTIGLDDDTADPLDEEATTDREEAESTSFWNRWVNYRRRHHTPGVWVIYFGLAAIPLFGIGQTVLTPKGRGAGFLLLCTYVASALALLMITSFLQMRRYLIQRRLPFTEKMAATWLGTGGALIIGLMLLCLLFPRPNTGYSMVDSFSASIKKASSPDDNEASRHGTGREGVKDDDKDGSGESEDENVESESEEGRQASEDAKQGKREGKQGKDGEEKSDSADSSDAEESDDQSEGDGDKKEESDGQGKESNRDSKQQEAEQEAEQDKSEPQNDENKQDEVSSQTTKPKIPPISNPLQNLSLPPIPKLIYVLLVAIGVLAVLFLYGRQIFGAVGAFVRDFMAFLRRLFGGREREVTEDDEEEKPQVETPKPFRSFKDPFASGMASRLSPQQLVAYTFEALQAWAYEQQCPRHDDQTPLEFAGQISDAHRAIGPHARNLAILYNQAAYAPNTLGTNALEHIQALWKALRK